MHYIRRMLLLLLALTPLGVCAQTQQSTKTERRSAMTDSVYRLTEVVVRSNQMLGSKFEVRNRTGAAYYISPEELGKFGYTDINRMLKSVPGVNVYEEDGFGSRLFHLSFELGVPFPYPCQCGMGGNTIIGNQCVTNISNLNFSHF